MVNQVDTLGLIGFTIDFTDGYNSQQVTATTDNSKVTTVGTFTGVIESTVTTTTTTNIQIGGDIDDFGIGSSCVLNSDGTIVAAGAAMIMVMAIILAQLKYINTMVHLGIN